MSMVFGVRVRFPFVFDFVSYPPGHILESVFLWCVYVDRNLFVVVQGVPPAGTIWRDSGTQYLDSSVDLFVLSTPKLGPPDQGVRSLLGGSQWPAMPSGWS